MTEAKNRAATQNGFILSESVEMSKYQGSFEVKKQELCWSVNALLARADVGTYTRLSPHNAETS